MPTEPRPVYIVSPPPPPPTPAARLWPFAVVVGIVAIVLFTVTRPSFGTDAARSSPTVDPLVVQAAAARAEASFQAVVNAKDAKCSAMPPGAAADKCFAELDGMTAKLDDLVSCLGSIAVVDQIASCQRSAGVTP